jgi:superfamily II DNA or RNA helicase
MRSDVQTKEEIELLITALEKDLHGLNKKREQIQKRIIELKHQEQLLINQSPSNSTSQEDQPSVANHSSESEKIALFRSLFRGRKDVFARRFESAKTGKSGYQPCCRNEWIQGICQKPAVKCTDCSNRDFTPVTDEIIKCHLLGIDSQKKATRDFTIGIYPLLVDETCWFLVIDFDKESWLDDVAAFMDICETYKVPAALERSRSGSGGHVWIFFSEPIKASLARKLGTFLVTETMEQRPEIGFDSYDRFFPSQDTMPQGGLGNLIALPLQKKPREKGNTLFIDKNFNPYEDQWAFLSSLQRMNAEKVNAIVDAALYRGDIIKVRTVVTEEDEILPWQELPSRQIKETHINGPLPERIQLVLGNQIYIEKNILPPALRNRLIRLAAFQNPEFYRAQAMRLPTYDKPRIIQCCEDFPKHLGLPRGCLEEVEELLHSLDIKPHFIDERFAGIPIDCKFIGMLRPDQELAAEAMLNHDTGVLSATTAFGKTVIAISLLASRGVNTLILVHRRQLLDQWVARLKQFLDLDPKQIGQIGSGKHKPTKVIDIALMQSLSKRGVVDDIVGEYGHLIVDECHHISARSFEVVARQCKAKYVTGLSATVIRKDGHHPIIFMNCGPIRYKVDPRKQAASRPFTHKVMTRETSFVLPPSIDNNKKTAIHEIYSALITDEKRSNMILEDVLQAVQQKRFPLLLTERREHLEKLTELLSPLITNVFIFKGGMGQKQREALISKLHNTPDNEEKIIIATGRYLGEGFDEARLDTLFLTMPVSWKGVLAQYAGRLHRFHDMKREIIVYDYADLNVPMLAKMYRRRLSGYRAIGYEVV